MANASAAIVADNVPSAMAEGIHHTSDVLGERPLALNGVIAGLRCRLVTVTVAT